MSDNIKKIWFFSQNSYMPTDGPHIRHYALGKYLVKEGYEPFVFAGNELHHVGTRIDTEKNDYKEKYEEGVHFFYLKTHHYSKNDIHRIFNIISYYFRLLRVYKKIAKKYGKPDIIYASSLYPTALIAGIKIAKKYGIKCISETRDILPEGFVTSGSIKEKGFIAKMCRLFMRKIYEKSSALVFTMSGGPSYIIDNCWDKNQGGKIDNNKIYYINNGIDLEVDMINKNLYSFEDSDIDSKETFKVVYFGAIRFLNQMPLFIDAAKELKRRGYSNIKILMWGNGTKLDQMKQEIRTKDLDNIILKGYVEKKYIPGIASRADLFIGTGNSCSVEKYGMSFNKLFDYFAAGKPIILPFLVADSLVQANGAGVEIKDATAVKLANTIIMFYEMNKVEYQQYCANSLHMAKKFDYSILAQEINKIIQLEL